MGKLIVILGKSGSGKSTIEKILERNYCYKRVISTTTRPPRSNEIPFVDYYFIPREVFEIYKRRGEFLESTQYPTNGVMHLYGVHIKDVNIEEEDNILIVERYGYEELIRNIGRENIISILVEADFNIRADRYRQRDKNYNEEDILDRAERDDRIFSGLEEEVDIVVANNGNIDETVKKILHEINAIKNREK